MDFYISRDPQVAGLGAEAPELPAGLRDRYGVGGSRPDQTRRPATYRPDALRVPRSVDRTVLDRSLAEINLKLAEPGDVAGRPVVVRLEPLDPARGRDVDASQALAHLRRAADEAGGDLRTAVGTPDPVGLEHLLFVGVGPVPWDSHPWDSHPWDSHDAGAVPWDSHGWFSSDSYIRNARGGPVPVSVAFRPDQPRPVVAGTGFDRRPVVAVLDTGIAGHDWFGTVGPQGGLPDGGFIRELADVQDAITASSRESGIEDRHIEDIWDRDVLTDPMTGVLSRHAGHGTFIAGIVQQIAPDSQVAMARVMAGDGVAYESDLIAALETLVHRVDRAQAPGGDPREMVDILALSMGYYIEDEQDVKETRQFTDLLNALADRGVLVVAAAGNNATMRPFYPAALAADPPAGGGPAVLSVGALNPNGTKAFFSNQAPWVHAWATGAGVVSTYPKLRGSMGPAQVMSDLGRESMDPDDFTSGFAVWHGTSFAAPHAAAVLANKLVAAADGGAPAMSNVTGDAMLERARRAVDACARQKD
ncbi:MAG TPA: S8 family serine peptidase [Actinophytocola sp.]|uniref:S8 family peptidase n=1 Tax=Actinophytocola sp. TaxID=1872138 RepID=UPI002F92846F